MSQNFFKSLNYTIGNEDVSLELGILPNNAQHIYAIAGSGSRIIPLISKNPRRISCVDASIEQLSLVELRIATLKSLNHKDFLSFWGYPSGHMSSEKRKEVFCDLDMSKSSQGITEKIFIENKWMPLLYLGRWERTFKKISKIVRGIVGAQGTSLFNCKSIEEQERYLREVFPWKSWSFVVFLLGNSTVFNALLYRGSFPKKNIEETMHGFYMERFRRLFRQGLVRRNFFLQLLFFGELKYLDGLPIECDPTIYLSAKTNLQKTKIDYLLGDLIEKVTEAKVPIDFLSLSDAPSYFEAPKEQEFINMLDEKILPGGIIVNRYYLRIPEGLDTSGYENITSKHKDGILNEKVQMFSFGIFQKHDS